jgi:hypothetical protein
MKIVVRISGDDLYHYLKIFRLSYKWKVTVTVKMCIEISAMASVGGGGLFFNGIQ